MILRNFQYCPKLLVSLPLLKIRVTTNLTNATALPAQNITVLPKTDTALLRLINSIDLLAIQQKSLDRALFLYIFIHEIRSSGVRASITIVHIRKFYKMYQRIVRMRFFFKIAKRSIEAAHWLSHQFYCSKVSHPLKYDCLYVIPLKKFCRNSLFRVNE